MRAPVHITNKDHESQIYNEFDKNIFIKFNVSQVIWRLLEHAIFAPLQRNNLKIQKKYRVINSRK